jgi:hypothetical protein
VVTGKLEIGLPKLQMKRVVRTLAMMHLCEGHTGFVVHFEDFLNALAQAADVRSKPRLHFMAV